MFGRFKGISTLHLAHLATIAQFRGIFAPLFADMSVLGLFKGISTLHLAHLAIVAQFRGIFAPLMTH
jgi:hypothetical protein